MWYTKEREFMSDISDSESKSINSTISLVQDNYLTTSRTNYAHNMGLITINTPLSESTGHNLHLFNTILDRCSYDYILPSTGVKYILQRAQFDNKDTFRIFCLFLRSTVEELCHQPGHATRYGITFKSNRTILNQSSLTNCWNSYTELWEEGYLNSHDY